MFSAFSWISESRGCDKTVDGAIDQKMAPAIPVVEIPSGLSSKRKWEADAADFAHGVPQDTKRRKTDVRTENRPSMPTVKPSSEVARRPESTSNVDLGRIHDAIESQFSLEILLKHNELRLINQELAKCQVALEQLRRCHLIPYPVSQSTPESMLNISNGIGPILGQKDKVPQWAAPYGVTDGPYSKHYAKWLIPDPSFDGVQVDWQHNVDDSRAGKTVPEGRATRHSIAEGALPASKSRSQRGSTAQKFQALSSGYPPPKEKAGPCVLKRGDGQWVKLVCPECHRDNFSSTQGFINHCRIAHKIEFKSHEEAAVASGQPIELDEVGGIVGEEKTQPTTNNLVHPMIRSTPPDREAYAALLSRIEASTRLFEQGKLPGVTSIPSSTLSTPVKASRPVFTPSHSFVPSSATPHLSELMRSKGFGGNLNDIVGEAKQKFDLDDVSSPDDDSDLEVNSQCIGGFDGTNSPLPAMRMPARAGASPAPFGRPTSSKGIDGRIARQPALGGISPRPSHATPVISTHTTINAIPHSRLANSQSSFDVHHLVNVDLEMMDGPSFIDLSPNTIASNNAPSLVSDDGDYDENDDAESADSEDDSSVAEIRFDDDGEKVVPRVRNRSGSGSDAVRLKKEEKHKHVTFVSPVKDVRERRGHKV